MKLNKIGFAVGLSALVAGLGIFNANRTGGTPSGTPGPVTAERGTSNPSATTVPLASGTPKAETPILEAKLAAHIQKMAPKEIEARMKEIDSEYFTEGMRDRLNNGDVSAQERAQAMQAFVEKNALFARWAELKIVKYDAAIKKIERHHAANVDRAVGDLHETN